MMPGLRHGLRFSLLAMLCVAPAWGQIDAARTTAREIAKQGLAAYDNGQYAEALDKLSRAYQIVRVPTLPLFMARTSVKLGKLIEASELYLEATRLAVTEGDVIGQLTAQADAVQERAALIPRIPKIVIQIVGADANAVEVTIDGQQVPSALLQPGQLVNPGTRRVAARMGSAQVVQDVALAESEQRSVTLTFHAAPGTATVPTPLSSVPPTTMDDRSTGRTLGWVAVGAGGAGVLFGGITGVLAVSKRSSLNDGGCVNNHCYADQKGDVNTYQTLRTLSTVGFAVGIVGAATGVTLLLTSKPKPQHEPTVTAMIGIGSAGLAGRF
jgi:hypothetical protein